MFHINQKNYNIELTRGNSAEIDTTPFIQDTEIPLELGEKDKVVFTVKSRSTNRIFIQKVLTSADYDEDKKLVLRLDPKDTIDMRSGNFYVYDLMLVTESGDVYTYIGNFGKIVPSFILLEAYGDLNNIPQESTQEPIEESPSESPVEENSTVEIEGGA